MSKVAIETGSPGIPTTSGGGGGWISGGLFFEGDPGGIPYERGGDTRRSSIWTWPNLFLTPKRDHFKL